MCFASLSALQYKPIAYRCMSRMLLGLKVQLYACKAHRSLWPSAMAVTCGCTATAALLNADSCFWTLRRSRLLLEEDQGGVPPARSQR